MTGPGELLRDRPAERWLVTGAAGFIGSNYVRYVLRETDDEPLTFAY